MKRRGVRGKLKPKMREASRAIVARVLGAAVDIWEAPYLTKTAGRRMKRTAKRESRRAVRRSARYEVGAQLAEHHTPGYHGEPCGVCGFHDLCDCVVAARWEAQEAFEAWLADRQYELDLIAAERAQDLREAWAAAA